MEKKKNLPRNEENKKLVLKRINIIQGQLNGVKEMIENERYCDDILIQLSAINKAIKSVANVILDEHCHTCLVENIQKGNLQIVDEISDLFKRFQ